MNHQQVPFRIHQHDLQGLNGDTLTAHPPGHSLPLEDTSGRVTCPDGARGTQPVRLAMGLGTATKAMSLHHAGESSALRGPDDVDKLTFIKDINRHLFALFQLKASDFIRTHPELS